MAESPDNDKMDGSDPTGRSLFRLLLFGFAAWAVVSLGAIVWFFATVPNPGLAAVAFPFYAWLIGYTPAGILMLLYGLIQWWRGLYRFSVLAWAALVYFLPMIGHGLILRLFLLMQPLSVQQGDEAMMAVAFTGPVFFLLYLVGLAQGFRHRHAQLKRTVRAILTPPAVGIGLSVAGMVAFTLTSTHWEHRADYSLSEPKVSWLEPRGMIVESVLEAKRDGPILFHAFYRDKKAGGGRSVPADEIEFGANRYQNGKWFNVHEELKKGDRYPIRFVWNKLQTTSLQSRRRVVFRINEGEHFGNQTLLKEFVIPVDPDPGTLSSFDNVLRSKKQGSLYGYVNRLGKMVIRPQFDWAGEFSEGLAVVRIGRKEGYIDGNGNVVIPVQFERATSFSEGLAAVQVGRAHGYIDKSGKFIISPRYDVANPFSGGLARVRVKNLEGFINRAGETVIEPRWQWATDFSEGRAAVQVDKKWGFIDEQGRWVVEPQYDAYRPFSEGKAEVALGSRWYRLDREGNVIPETN